MSFLLFLLCLSGNTNAGINKKKKEIILDAHVLNKVYYGNKKPSKKELTPQKAVSLSDYTEISKSSNDEKLLNKEVAFISASSVPLYVIINQLSDILNIPVSFESGIDKNIPITLKMENTKVKNVINRIQSMIDSSIDIRNSTLKVFIHDTRIFKITIPPSEYMIENSVGSVVNIKKQSKNQTAVNMGTKINGLDFYKDLEDNIKSLISPEGRFSINKVAGILTVTDRVRNLNVISEFMKQANAHSHRQILIKARIHKVTLNDMQTHGIDWNMLFDIIKSNLSRTVSIGSHTSDIVTNLGSALDFSLNEIDTSSDTTVKTSDLIYQALSQNYDVETVAEPIVLALNNIPTALQEAHIQTYIEKVTKTTDSDDNIEFSADTEELRSGFNMNLVASVIGGEHNPSDGWVIIKLTPSVETVDSLTRVDFGDGAYLQLPEKTGTIMTSQMKIKSGHTRLIGGLFITEKKNTAKGIPLLNKIPFIGRHIFSSEANKMVRKEILIEISPVILN